MGLPAADGKAYSLVVWRDYAMEMMMVVQMENITRVVSMGAPKDV